MNEEFKNKEVTEEIVEVPVSTLETKDNIEIHRKEEMNVNKKLFWGIAISQFAIIVLLGVLIIQLSNRTEKLESDLSNISIRVDEFDGKINESYNTAMKAQMSIYMSEGIVTDTLVVQRAIFSNESVTIDIRPQPLFSSHFLGQGRFDLSDRELKQNLLDLIDKMKNQYDSFGNSEKFENLDVYITQNNYDVGKYKDGKITLSGE